MNILPYQMPPFARMQWASGKIKEKYEPMWEKAKNVFAVLEKESVVRGLRKVTTDSVRPEDMDRKLQEYAKRGLVFVPIRRVGEYSGMASYHPPAVPGKPWNFYGVVARDIKDATEFIMATQNHDHKTVGRLLGYPECCVDSFHENFVEKSISDYRWQQACNSSDIEVRDNVIRVRGVNWKSNTMYRNVGVGPMFHSPCSLDCKHTEKLAESWIDLAQEMHVEGLLELEMFLRMPVEWDAFKGIAYLRTPVFKLSVNTVMCTERFKVQMDGTYYPLDAPKSTQFPWSEAIPTLKRNENKLTSGGTVHETP